MYQLTKRLEKEQDLKKSITEIAKKEKVKAAVVICSVGSLSKASLRMPGATKTKQFEGEFEVISLNGRISQDGSHVHLHLAISDINGQVYGGHLLDGNIIRTTLELVLLCFDDIIYKSVMDPKTGFLELEVQEN